MHWLIEYFIFCIITVVLIAYVWTMLFPSIQELIRMQSRPKYAGYQNAGLPAVAVSIDHTTGQTRWGIIITNDGNRMVLCGCGEFNSVIDATGVTCRCGCVFPWPDRNIILGRHA